jgi:hypothetical protein
MIFEIKQIILGYISWLRYYLSKSYKEKIKKEAKRRIEICEKCEMFYSPGRNCMICGCYMDVKTKMDFKLDENGKSIDGCYEKKW